jgi:hypothetical protein
MNFVRIDLMVALTTKRGGKEWQRKSVLLTNV